MKFLYKFVFIILLILVLHQNSFSQCLRIGASGSNTVKEVSPGSQQTLSWDYTDNSQASVYKFRLRRSAYAAGKYPVITDIVKTARSFVFNVPTTLGNYHYFLEACGDVNCSNISAGSNHVLFIVK